MSKSKVLQENDIPRSKVVKNRPTNKKKRKKKGLTIDLLNLLRISFLLFLVGVIVFNYYLITENQLGSFYLKFWNSNKEVLTPILLFIGYTLTIFLFGYWLGKRR